VTTEVGVAELEQLTGTVPQVGRLEQILLRPARRVAPVEVQHTAAIADQGLDGDRRAARVPRRRLSGDAWSRRAQRDRRHRRGDPRG